MRAKISMAQSAAHKTDAPRRATCRDVLGTPAHRVADATERMLKGDTRTEIRTEGSDEIARVVERMRTTIRRALQIINRDKE